MTTPRRLLLEALLASLFAVLIGTAMQLRSPLGGRAPAVAARFVELVPATLGGVAATNPRANRPARSTCAVDDLSDLRLLPAGCRRCSH